MAEKDQMIESVKLSVESVVQMSQNLVELTRKNADVERAVAEQRISNRGFVALFESSVASRLQELPMIGDGDVDPQNVASIFANLVEAWFGKDGVSKGSIEANIIAPLKENSDFYTGPDKQQELIASLDSNKPVQIADGAVDGINKLKEEANKIFQRGTSRIPDEIRQEWDAELRILEERIGPFSESETAKKLTRILENFRDFQLEDGAGWNNDWVTRWNKVKESL